MTQIIIAVCNNGGMLMTADSNVVIHHRAQVRNGFFRREEISWPHGFVSQESKICLSKSGVAVASIGGVGTRQDATQVFLESLVGNSDLPFDDLKTTIVKALKERYGDGLDDMMLLVAGYDRKGGKSIPRVERVYMSTGEAKPVDATRSGILVEGAYREIPDRLLRPIYTLVSENRRSRIQAFKYLDYDTFSIDDFARLSIFMIRTTEGILSFSEDSRLIGGPIDMVIMRPDGSSGWLSRHNPATSGDPDLLETRVPESVLPSQFIKEGVE